MSAPTNITTPIFAARDISLLVSGYAQDNFHQWGTLGLLEQVLGQGPYIAITDWELNELMAQFFCVINPNSPQPGILRIIMTPEFIWLGFHAVQTSAPLPLADYSRHLVAAIRDSPLATEVMAFKNLHFDNEWMGLLRALLAHVGSKQGSLALATMTMAVVPAAMPANVPAPVFVLPAQAVAPEILMIDYVPIVVPPPVIDPHYGGGVMITGRDGKEVPRHRWRY